MYTEHHMFRAISLYNRLTNPATLRTDAEHRRCRKAAKSVLKHIGLRYLRTWWSESENGDLRFNFNHRR